MNKAGEAAKADARRSILELGGKERGCTPGVFRKSGKYRTYFCKSEKSAQRVKSWPDKSFVLLAAIATLLWDIFEKSERARAHTGWNGGMENKTHSE
jgi:hypothetical protein